MVDKPQFEPITPADITLSQPPGAGEKPQSKAPEKTSNHRLLIASALLLVLALLVVFVLPVLVDKNEQPVIAPQTESNTSNPQASPYQQQQLAERRRQAQDILAQIVSQDSQLKNRHVELWAKQAHEAALALAVEGDTAYSKADYEQALALYQNSLDSLNRLYSQADTVVTDSLSKGLSALESGDETNARSALELALNIDPANTAALRAMERLALLPQTTPLLTQAHDAISRQEWKLAKSALQQLLGIDKDHQHASQLLGDVSSSYNNQQYHEAMSLGLQSLQQHHPEQAITFFKKALTYKSGDQSALASLSQAQIQHKTNQTSQLLARAQEQESAENWPQAVNTYLDAQKLDDSLMDARIGLLRSEARAKLDQQIEHILSDPLRLAATGVYEDARQLLADARKITAPGPRLQRQINALDTALTKARQPVTVVLLSDNATKVTLLRKGELGTFQQHNIKLKPGRYVALGERAGYRDVRVEFSVLPANNAPVEVRCEEAL